ncbi:recombinase family protein [Streptomyces sp. HB132]|uniref:recombinase family protein n=1 Tax=Streptomyces sp. HB132 TaxID=767388 RepID=UPI0019606F36|nr:recombinase family protein [Streptomyces sp. HB132]MBM7437360.1 DNA invertase Pin-like site-specific DNA recombinase [Streptomyces sp. HB132]
MFPVGAYARASEDKALRANAAGWREIGDQVAEQFKDMDELAAELNLTITRRYSDNHTPAGDPRVIRNDFEMLLADLENGTIRGVLFYHSDRLVRQEYDAARINRLFQLNPRYVGRAVVGGTDLATQEGRSMLTVQAAMGGMEVYSTKRRVTRRNKGLAERGHMHGAPRPFGWAEDRRTLHDTEAEVLRQAVLAIPDGLTVGEIRKQWINLGYEPTRNKRKPGTQSLQHSTVEARLVNPRICGYRTYLPQAERRNIKRPWMPEFVIRKDGRPVMGDWEAIVSPEEWQACVATIEERQRARAEGRAPHSTSAKYLLSGIARCGKCSFPLMSNQYSKGTTSYERYGYRYACLTTLGGCGGVTRVGPPMEDLVETAFLQEVRRSLGMVVEQRSVDETQHDARLSEIDQEIKQVSDRRREKRIGMGTALDLLEELEGERDELNRQRRRLVATKVRRRNASPSLLKEWMGYSVPQKKAQLRELIRAVMVHPAGRGRKFDPELIEIAWNEDDHPS